MIFFISCNNSRLVSTLLMFIATNKKSKRKIKSHANDMFLKMKCCSKSINNTQLTQKRKLFVKHLNCEIAQCFYFFIFIFIIIFIFLFFYLCCAANCCDCCIISCHFFIHLSHAFAYLWTQDSTHFLSSNAISFSLNEFTQLSKQCCVIFVNLV